MNELQIKIKSYNDAYRKGTPAITDAEYDILLRNLQSQIPSAEYNSFIKTLTEESGSAKHEYVIGSLNKLKYGEGDLAKWLKKNNITKTIFVSEKIDGCSFVASYVDGKLKSCYSRGDGENGTDWTDKAVYVLPTPIRNFTGDIRGEFCLANDSHTILGYKNRRNGVVGIMNNDEVDTNKLKHVVPLVYELLSSTANIFEQFADIRDNGFDTPHYTLVANLTDDCLKALHDKWKSESPYDIDGLVLSDVSYKNENVFYPEGKVAYKVNSEGVHATVVGINWNVSKFYKLKPVVEIEPVDINGTTVTYVTGNNAKYIMDNKITIGTKISIIRAGEIIPYIVEVFE